MQASKRHPLMAETLQPYFYKEFLTTKAKFNYFFLQCVLTKTHARRQNKMSKDKTTLKV